MFNFLIFAGFFLLIVIIVYVRTGFMAVIQTLDKTNEILGEILKELRDK